MVYIRRYCTVESEAVIEKFGENDLRITDSINKNSIFRLPEDGCTMKGHKITNDDGEYSQ